MRSWHLLCLLVATSASAARYSPRLENCGACKDEIAALRTRLDALAPGDPMLPETRFRLAGLYWEASEFHLTAARQGVGPRRGEHLTRAQEASTLARQLYTKLIEDHLEFEHRDEALLALAHLLTKRDEAKQALEVYKQFFVEHPDSRFLPDARLAIAEHLFDRQKWEVALEAYKQAAGFRGSPVHTFALYMQGWCSFELGDTAAAMLAWKSAALSANAGVRTSAERQIDQEIIHEARVDYVHAFALARAPRQARADFARLATSPDGRIPWVVLLDLLYRQGDKDAEAAITLAELEKDCKARKARACNALALLSAEGLGVEKDERRATTLLTQACQTGAARACANLCLSAQRNLGMDSGNPQAAALRAKVCTESPQPSQSGEDWAPWESLERVPTLAPASTASQGLSRTEGWRRAREVFHGTEASSAEDPPFALLTESSKPPPKQAFESSMDRDAIRSVIRSHRSELAACHTAALKRTPSLEGKVVIKFIINDKGSVVSSEVVQATVGDKALEACVAEEVRRWRFPAPKGGGVEIITYPFIFRSSPPEKE